MLFDYETYDQHFFLLAQSAKHIFLELPKLTWPEWTTWPMKKRIEEATRLLKAAGFSKANPLQMEVTALNSWIPSEEAKMGKAFFERSPVIKFNTSRSIIAFCFSYI